jgi:anti-sigma factor ChrR (cupin superfamily)
MLRCKEVTRLCASEDIRGARWRTRIAVRTHLLMCRHCRRYVRELSRIGTAVRALAHDEADDVDRNEALIRRVLPDDSA